MEGYKKLINTDVDPPQYTEKAEWAETSIPSVRSRSRSWVRILTAVVASLCLAVTLILAMHVFMKTVLSDDNKFKEFLGHMGSNHHSMETMKHHSGMMSSEDESESVLTSVSEHFVATAEEKLWVIKDLAAGVQILKSETSDGAICYVSTIPKQESTRVTRQTEDDAAKAKEYISMVYVTVDSPPIEDLTVLGKRGKQLCSDVPTVWINPAPENHNDVDSEDYLDQDAKAKLNMTKAMGGWKESNNQSVGRSKRNIRQCRTSCCWLVCCCNVYHFTWETTEYFTCVHVCSGCTAKYQSKIVKIC